MKRTLNSLYLLASLTTVLLLVGCGHSDSSSPTNQATAQNYTLRGIITQLPDPANPASDLMIHHEPLHDFIGQDGKATTMQAMTMPFTPGPNVSLKDLHTGDKVSFMLTVDWKHLSQAVTQIKKLPADTPMDFEAKP